VLWQVASRADQGRPPGPNSLAVRVVIDRGRRVIAASGMNVFATDVLGRPVWTVQMPAASLRLWQWGETLLVASLNQLWLLNAETGQRQAEIDITALEAPFAAQDNPDGMAVQLERILVGPDRAMLTLGPSLVAIDRAGKVSWRLPRPVDSRGRHTAIAVPLFATETHLVTRESGTTPRIALRQMGDGKVIWRATDSAPPQPLGPGGPGGDDAWKASEGAIVGQYLILRESSRLQVRMLATSKMVWHLTSQTPVVAMKRFGDLVLFSADRLFAYRLADGKLAWEKPVRGARLAVTRSGDAIVVANEDGVSIRDVSGEAVWQERFHAAIGSFMPDQVNVDGEAAYVTFRPRDEGPPGGPPGGPHGGPKPTESPGAAPPIDAIAYRLGPDQTATPQPSPTP
jgi:outer membrane protein assembly factor BamB